jgi:hypothetical protein
MIDAHVQYLYIVNDKPLASVFLFFFFRIVLTYLHNPVNTITLSGSIFWGQSELFPALFQQFHRQWYNCFRKSFHSPILFSLPI